MTKPIDTTYIAMKTLQTFLATLFLCFFFNTYAQPRCETVYMEVDILKDSENNFYKKISYDGFKNNYVQDYRTINSQTIYFQTFTTNLPDRSITNMMVGLKFGNAEDTKKQSEKYSHYTGLFSHFFKKVIKKLELYKRNISIDAASRTVITQKPNKQRIPRYTKGSQTATVNCSVPTAISAKTITNNFATIQWSIESSSRFSMYHKCKRSDWKKAHNKDITSMNFVLQNRTPSTGYEIEL